MLISTQQKDNVVASKYAFLEKMSEANQYKIEQDCWLEETLN